MVSGAWPPRQPASCGPPTGFGLVHHDKAEFGEQLPAVRPQVSGSCIPRAPAPGAGFSTNGFASRPMPRLPFVSVTSPGPHAVLGHPFGSEVAGAQRLPMRPGLSFPVLCSRLPVRLDTAAGSRLPVSACPPAGPVGSAPARWRRVPASRALRLRLPLPLACRAPALRRVGRPDPGRGTRSRAAEAPYRCRGSSDGRRP